MAGHAAETGKNVARHFLLAQLGGRQLLRLRPLVRRRDHSEVAQGAIETLVSRDTLPRALVARGSSRRRQAPASSVSRSLPDRAETPLAAAPSERSVSAAEIERRSAGQWPAETPTPLSSSLSPLPRSRSPTDSRHAIGAFRSRARSARAVRAVAPSCGAWRCPGCLSAINLFYRHGYCVRAF